jgi:glyoxylase-like metal-dependent hydrolase (beta-lactamase superfamily II)
MIKSHTHADHTGGNVEFPVTTRFVAHVNTRTNMQKMDQFQGDNAKFLPTQVFQDKLSLFSGADRIDLYYFGPGGTNGDAWIVIPSLRLMIGADDFNKGLTLLDAMNGGSAKAFQQTLARVASEIKNVDTVVTGHGGVLTWNDFLEFTQLTNDFYTWVRAQKAAGKTVEQTAMEWQIPPKYVGYAQTNPMFLQRIVQVVYNEQ